MPNLYAGEVNEAQASKATRLSFTDVTSTQILSGTNNRVMFTVYNNGAGNLYLLCGAGTASSTNFDFIVPPGFFLNVDFYTGTVNAIFDTAGSAAYITEYT